MQWFYFNILKIATVIKIHRILDLLLLNNDAYGNNTKNSFDFELYNTSRNVYKINN